MNDKYCLITGATGGLGRAITYEAASRGYELILVDLDDRNLESLKIGLKNNFNISVITFNISILDKDQMTGVWDYLKENNIKLDMLINVAGRDEEGLFTNTLPIVSIGIAELNAVGTLSMISNAIKYKSNTLRVINISSMAGFYPMPLKAVYSASKRFLIDLGYSLNDELNSQNIYITTVCPAGLPTRADIIEKIDSQGFFGRVTTLNVGIVAKRIFEKAFRNKKIYIPGFLNQVVVIISNLIPQRVLAKLVGKRWRKTNCRISHS
ncbi:SDR family NAD(P)-dependent oxidoreductase [Mycoplasmatota bacterium zrk1]